MTITRTMQADLYAYTTRVLRARDDYYSHPSRACHKRGCDHLRDNNNRYCNYHQNEADRRANARRANQQAAKAVA